MTVCARLVRSTLPWPLGSEKSNAATLCLLFLKNVCSKNKKRKQNMKKNTFSLRSPIRTCTEAPKPWGTIQAVSVKMNQISAKKEANCDWTQQNSAKTAQQSQHFADLKNTVYCIQILLFFFSQPIAKYSKGEEQDSDKYCQWQGPAEANSILIAR